MRRDARAHGFTDDVAAEGDSTIADRNGVQANAIARPLMLAVCLLGPLASSGAGAEQDITAMLAGEEIVDSASLEALRGRAGDTSITLESNQDLRSTVNGSLIQAGSMVSGAVTIEERAMDNFSGVGLFNIVTGSNNAVDAAIGINFNLQ